ncbi:MAG: hypothetical protein KAG61_05545 [Bacteriovoracaceae bacterium]|nr:hypothetical protein [Bacteriovoracaceae bacterium]
MIVKYYTDTFTPDTYLQAASSPSRGRDFYLSRTALKNCLVDLSPDFDKIGLDDLAIENHQHLEKYPQIAVSLSHTKEYAAAIISDDPHVVSVGIDLELTTRPIKKGIIKYFDHNFDSAYSPLELWVIKEACFKAAWPIFQKEKASAMVLKDLWVNQTEFGVFDIKHPVGRITLNYIDLFDEKFLVATAIIKE